jgi:hypothetical protein
VKEKQHLDVRELSETLERFGGVTFGKGNARFFSTPEVVFGMGTKGLYKTDGLDLLDHSNAS